MTYLRGVLSGVAALMAAWVGSAVVLVVGSSHRQAALGLGALVGGTLESLVSPLFWLLVLVFFGLLFAASRLKSDALRGLLFWTPTLAFLTLGLSCFTALAYVWMHFRRG